MEQTKTTGKSPGAAESKGVSGSPPSLLPQPAAVPIKLSDVTVLRKNWKGPVLNIDYDSYTGKTSVVGARKISAIDPAIKLPAYLSISELTDGSRDIAGVPTMTASDTTLEMSWGNGGKEARIDFAPYFMIRPFPIPTGTKARIPLVFDDLVGVGKCVVIKFSDATFGPITKREKKETTQQAKGDPDQE